MAESIDASGVASGGRPPGAPPRVFLRGGDPDYFALVAPNFERALSLMNGAIVEYLPSEQQWQTDTARLATQIETGRYGLGLTIRVVDEAQYTMTMSRWACHPETTLYTADLVIRRCDGEAVRRAFQPLHALWFCCVANHDGPHQRIGLHTTEMEATRLSRHAIRQKVFEALRMAMGLHVPGSRQAQATEKTPVQQLALHLCQRQVPSEWDAQLRADGFDTATIAWTRQCIQKRGVLLSVSPRLTRDALVIDARKGCVVIANVDNTTSARDSPLTLQLLCSASTVDNLTCAQWLHVVVRGLALWRCGYDGVYGLWPEAVIEFPSTPAKALSVASMGWEVQRKITSAGKWDTAWLKRLAWSFRHWKSVEIALRKTGDKTAEIVSALFGWGHAEPLREEIWQMLMEPTLAPLVDPLKQLKAVDRLILHGTTDPTQTITTSRRTAHVYLPKRARATPWSIPAILVDLLGIMHEGENAAAIDVVAALWRLIEQHADGDTTAPAGVQISGGARPATQEALGRVLSDMVQHTRSPAVLEGPAFRQWLRAHRRIYIEEAVGPSQPSSLLCLPLKDALLFLLRGDSIPAARAWQLALAAAYIVGHAPILVDVDTDRTVHSCDIHAPSHAQRPAQAFLRTLTGSRHGTANRADFGATRWSVWASLNQTDQAAFIAALRWFAVHSSVIEAEVRPLPTDSPELLKQKRADFALRFHPDQGNRSSLLFGDGWEHWDTIRRVVQF